MKQDNEICKSCNGTGNCSRCHGTGNDPDIKAAVPCRRCGGSGICPGCGGSGIAGRKSGNLAPPNHRKRLFYK